MSKIDFNKTMKDIEDKELDDQVVPKSQLEQSINQLIISGVAGVDELMLKLKKIFEVQKFTLKKICIDSLLGNFEDEKDLSGEDKLKRYELAMKIKAGGEIELASEDIASLKKLIGKRYNALVVGQAWNILENKDEINDKPTTSPGSDI